MAQLCRSRWVAVRVFFLLSLWTSSAAPQQRPREAVLSPGSVQPRQRLRRENTGLRGRRLISQEDDAAEAGEAGATVHHSPVRPLADERLDQPMPSPPLSPQSPLFEHNWHVPTRTNNALVDGPAGQSHQRRLDELAALSAPRLERQMAGLGNIIIIEIHTQRPWNARIPEFVTAQAKRLPSVRFAKPMLGAGPSDGPCAA